MKNAWNEKKEAFTQSYNSDHLDASVVLMEPYGFIEAKNEKYMHILKYKCSLIMSPIFICAMFLE